MPPMLPCQFVNGFGFDLFLVISGFFGQSTLVVTAGASNIILLFGGGTPVTVTVFNLAAGFGSVAIIPPAHIQVPSPLNSDPTNPVWNVLPTGLQAM